MQLLVDLQKGDLTKSIHNYLGRYNLITQTIKGREYSPDAARKKEKKSHFEASGGFDSQLLAWK